MRLCLLFAASDDIDGYEKEKIMSAVDGLSVPLRSYHYLIFFSFICRGVEHRNDGHVHNWRCPMVLCPSEPTFAHTT